MTILKNHETERKLSQLSQIDFLIPIRVELNSQNFIASWNQNHVIGFFWARANGKREKSQTLFWYFLSVYFSWNSEVLRRFFVVRLEFSYQYSESRAEVDWLQLNLAEFVKVEFKEKIHSQKMKKDQKNWTWITKKSLFERKLECRSGFCVGVSESGDSFYFPRNYSNESKF